MEYNLKGRTLKFSKDVIKLAYKIEKDLINRSLITQLVRSATSVGANYKEANSGSSKKDFKNKISISRKEINETKYWIEILADMPKMDKEKLRMLWKEAHELSLIFNKIYHTLNNKN